MYFNSTAFIGFLTVFLLLYFLLKDSLSSRNRLIVGASYFFYAWWDWRFTSLLLLSSLVDYFVGKAIPGSSQAKRRRLLAASLLVNLGVLGFFKYYNFFIGSTVMALSQLGIDVDPRLLNIVLPVGISFYTFQSLSYTIDVYRRTIEPTTNLTAFLAYVSFFPQLVAGPIERASSLLPQFLSERTINREKIELGIWLVLWGLFKKVVVADSLAPVVDMVYSNPSIEGPMIAIATLAFGFQIYCDFSGYSDIARGIASILGFHLMLNFKLPYTALTPSDFWKRWHISLSSWFRDYVYIPLGGNRGSPWRTRLNLILTMLLAGLWHGAGWNFVLWGLWHGLVLTLFAKAIPRNRFQAAGSWALTMTAIFYGWLLFRAQSMEQIWHLTSSLWIPSIPPWAGHYILFTSVFCAPMILMELWQKYTQDLMPTLRCSLPVRTGVHAIMIYMIVLFWDTRGTPFIYFQF